MHRRWSSSLLPKRFILTLISLLATLCLVAAESYPSPNDGEYLFVHDYAGVLSASDRRALENLSEQIEDSVYVQIATVIMDSLSVDTDIDNTVGSEAETKMANYEFISADQVAKDALETIKSEHAQFDLTEVKDIQIPSELYILSLKKNNELKNTDDVFEIFEGADIWGKCEIQKKTGRR